MAQVSNRRSSLKSTRPATLTAAVMTQAGAMAAFAQAFAHDPANVPAQTANPAGMNDALLRQGPNAIAAAFLG